MGKRGRPRKTNKRVKHGEEKPLEKQTEEKQCTAKAEEDEEDKTTKRSDAVSLSKSREPNGENEELMQHVEDRPERKKRKYESEGAAGSTTYDSDDKNEVGVEEAKPELAGGGDEATIRIERCNS